MSIFYHLPIVACAVVAAISLTACESKSKRDFNAGCQSGGTDRSTCSCVYDKLEAHYSPQFMEKLGEQQVSQLDLPHDFSEQMLRAAQACQSR
ncbi:hypothetical protein F4U02_09360 [Acinetobacter haemolyticus]|uniref:hypothetical protein n=1 Tax=Acinetobacter haemolyticus TaxID=29430 RepID=UPI0012986608|nr:hypothetical protein [Acinetobacter haemolyticus]MQZ31199.1 hypothetical protein [Acinetobacter haemolyticus]